MRSLSIQVQPNRAPGLNMDRVTEAFRHIALITGLVERSHFDQGEDKGPYFNFTFGTSRAAELWMEIQRRIYRDQEIGPPLQRASIVTCSSEQGWDDYALLLHFDPNVPLDPDSNLT